MVSLISTGSNYIIVIMGVIYAITCFTVFLPSTEKRQVKRMDRQELFMFVFHFICYGVLFAKTLDTKIIFLYLAQVVFFKMLIFVYSRVYVDCSRILMNHTCFLLLIGFVMLTRLSFDKAVKQFIIAAATSLIVLFIPYFMEKAVWLKKLKFMATSCLLLTFLTVVFVLAPMNGEGGLYMLLCTSSMLYHHLLNPMAALLSYLLLEREPHLPRSDVRWALLPTLAYAAVILPLNILRVIVGPYPFFEVYHQPVYVSVLWAVGLLGVNYLYAWLLWRLGGGRPRSAR